MISSGEQSYGDLVLFLFIFYDSEDKLGYATVTNIVKTSMPATVEMRNSYSAYSLGVGCGFSPHLLPVGTQLMEHHLPGTLLIIVPMGKENMAKCMLTSKASPWK